MRNQTARPSPLSRGGTLGNSCQAAEPLATAPPCQPGLVIVPLLAFDRQGGRMGYGQGHYDRTLAALRAQGEVVALGLAFDAQSVANLPIEDHDETLDGILTQMRYIPVQRKI